MNLLKERFRNQQPVIVVNVGGRNPDVMAVLAKAGAHAAFIDCERTGIGLDVATELIRAAKVVGLTTLVRSWSKDPAVLVQFMDRQVDGLVVPHINCAQDAVDVVELVRYACGNDQASSKIIIVQIETRQAIEALDEIISVTGVDAYLIGPNDLAYSLMGQRSARTPDVLAAVADIAQRLKAAGKPFGLPVKLEELPDFLASGACLLYYPIEWLLTSALKDLTSRLDELSPPGNQSSVLE
jgi:4-hydroxy-2-oxoheptanedioate aldolase